MRGLFNVAAAAICLAIIAACVAGFVWLFLAATEGPRAIRGTLYQWDQCERCGPIRDAHSGCEEAL